jgi:hypothetical protein
MNNTVCQVRCRVAYTSVVTRSPVHPRRTRADHVADDALAPVITGPPEVLEGTLSVGFRKPPDPKNAVSRNRVRRNRVMAIAVRRRWAFPGPSRIIAIDVNGRMSRIHRLTDYEVVILFDPPLVGSNKDLITWIEHVAYMVTGSIRATGNKRVALDASFLSSNVSTGWLDEADILADRSRYERILSVVKEEYPPGSSEVLEATESPVLGHLQQAQRAQSERRTSVGAILESIASTQREIENLNVRLDAEVEVARRAEITWRQIGQAIGITESSAYRRFDPEGRRKYAESRRTQNQGNRSSTAEEKR